LCLNRKGSIKRYGFLEEKNNGERRGFQDSGPGGIRIFAHLHSLERSARQPYAAGVRALVDGRALKVGWLKPWPLKEYFRNVQIEKLNVLDEKIRFDIDEIINAQMDFQRVPGLALGIFHNGEPLLKKGYGNSNIELGVNVSPQTLFQSGSIGKIFTAACILLLVEDGVLNLDAKITTYFPDAPDTWRNIELRSFLNHTSGLEDGELDLQHEYTDTELLQRMYTWPMKFEAGTGWEYSNGGYEILGVLIKLKTGEHFGKFLKKRIFEPAGMSTARVISDRDIIFNRAAGYEWLGDELKNQNWVSQYLNSTGDGALYLSLNDYQAWDKVVSERSILKPETWAVALQPTKAQGGAIYPYGLGWEIYDVPSGCAVIGHDGAWQGFVTGLRRYESHGLTFVVLTNAADTDVDMILEKLIERVLRGI